MLQFLTNDIPEESPGDAAVTGRARGTPGTCWWADSADSPGAAAWRPQLGRDPPPSLSFPCDQQDLEGGTGLLLTRRAPGQLSMGG